MDLCGWKSTLTIGYLIRGEIPNACVGGFGDQGMCLKVRGYEN